MYFVCVITFIPQNGSVKVHSHYSQLQDKELGSDRLSDLPKTTKPVGGGAT